MDSSVLIAGNERDVGDEAFSGTGDQLVLVQIGFLVHLRHPREPAPLLVRETYLG